jgi:hypothetical protein
MDADVVEVTTMSDNEAQDMAHKAQVMVTTIY